MKTEIKTKLFLGFLSACLRIWVGSQGLRRLMGILVFTCAVHGIPVEVIFAHLVFRSRSRVFSGGVSLLLNEWYLTVNLSLF